MSSGLNLGKTSAMLYVYQQNWRQHLPLTATRCELPCLVVWGVSQEMTSMLNRTIGQPSKEFRGCMSGAIRTYSAHTGNS